MTASRANRSLGIAAALVAAGALASCSSGWTVGSAATSSAPITSVAPVPSTPASTSPVSTSPDAGAAPTSAESSAPAPVAVTAPLLTGGPVATDSPHPQKADVVLSVLGWDARAAAVQAGGYVSVLQARGTCTLELTMGARRVAVSAAAEPDASTTVCGNLSVGRARVVPGSWTAVLRYSSSTTVGVSAPATVQVPR
jgi:hypothetical protein